MGVILIQLQILIRMIALLIKKVEVPGGDIGVAVELRKRRSLTDEEILFYLTKHFIPSSSTEFEKKNYSGKSRSFQIQWI